MNTLIYRLLILFSFFITLEYLYVELFGFDNPLKPYRIIGLIIIILFILKKTLDKRILLDRYDLLFVIIFLYGIFTAFYVTEVNFNYTTNDLQLILFGFLIYIVIKNLQLSIRQIKSLFLSFYLGISVNVIYIFYKVIVLNDSYRLNGFFKNPNHVAGIIAMFIFYLIYIKKTKDLSLFNNLLLQIATIILFISILLTGSRSALLALAISFVFLYFHVIKKNIFKLITLGLVILSFYLSFSYFNQIEDFQRLNQRFDYENIEGGSGRTDIWRSAMILGVDSNFVGVGLSQYRTYHNEYIRKLMDIKSSTVLEYDLGTHSDYVSMIVEFGLIGITCYLIIILNLLVSSYKINKEDKYFASFIHFSLFMIFFQGIFQVSYILPYYWFIIALSIAYFRIIKKENNESH